MDRISEMPIQDFKAIKIGRRTFEYSAPHPSTPFNDVVWQCDNFHHDQKRITNRPYYFLIVEIPKGRYKGHVPIKLVAINTTANTNNTIASVPEISPAA